MPRCVVRVLRTVNFSPRHHSGQSEVHPAQEVTGRNSSTLRENRHTGQAQYAADFLFPAHQSLSVISGIPEHSALSGTSGAALQITTTLPFVGFDRCRCGIRCLRVGILFQGLG